MPEADCTIMIDGQTVACTRDAKDAGEPTALNGLSFGWGRSSLWEQPDAGSLTFRLRDKRTVSRHIRDIVRAGSSVDVWASAPNPDPQPTQPLRQTFETADERAAGRFSVLGIAPTVAASNLYPNPNMSSLTGKTAGGSATLALSTAWAWAAFPSISITPNGSSNASGIFPAGGSGTSVFEAGKTYTVSVYFRLAQPQGGTLGGDARRLVLRANGTTVVRSEPAPNVAGSSRLSITFTMQESWTSANIIIWNGSARTADVAWVDAYMITEGSELLTYFDGNTEAGDGYTYYWVGETANSISRKAYAITDPAAAVVPQQGGAAEGDWWGLMDGKTTRAKFRFPAATFGSRWETRVQPMMPDEEWSVSVSVKLNGTPTAPAQCWIEAETWFSSRLLDGAGPLTQVTLNGSARVRVSVTTDGWRTFELTAKNIGTRPCYPVLAITTDPVAQSQAASYPGVDGITFTRPAQARNEVLVWAGRVTDIDVSRAVQGQININVTAVEEAAQAENISVGASPWPVQTLATRIRSVIEEIPNFVRKNLSIDDSQVPGTVVAGRDVDKQPALTLLRDYAMDGMAVVWPINTPVTRNHLWIEPMRARFESGGASGVQVVISACSIPAGSFALVQTAEQVVTVVDIRYKILEDGSYVDRTVTATNTDAVEVYGARRLEVSTELFAAAFAGDMALVALALASAQEYALRGVQFDSRHASGPDAQDLLMKLLNSSTRPAAKLTITDLPEWVPAGIASGFVEGGTIKYQDGRWQFDLNLTATST